MKNGFLYIVLILFSNCIFAQLNQKEKEVEINKIVNRIHLPKIPNYAISVVKYGAKGDSVTNCKRAFDKAMKACERRNGGTIIVPKGTYTINGPIHFVSNVRLHLEEGAKIRFGSNPKDYPLVLTSWEGTMLYNYSPMIYGYNVENIAITGNGIIDGEASNSWIKWKTLEKEDQQLSRDMNHNKVPIEKRIFGEGHYLRPQLIQFVNSKNILIEDVQIEDAPFWCVHLLKSKSITIRGVKYDAHNYNNDGIDPEYSSDILIENVKFNNGDDNVAIKSGRDDEGRSNSDTPSENIVIRNCEFKGLHAIVIGSEMSAGVRNVYVDNCKASGYLKRGLYIKTNSDRGSYIKDIYFSNIAFAKVEDCIYITSNYHGEGSGLNPSKISEIYFSNISCELATNTGIVIEGYPNKKVENIKLDTITIQSAKNGMTITNTENVSFNEVTIGEKATIPTAVK
ncbi:glycoside hydrolase family 28 protein [Flavobacterium cellulosilyticum]|uniref:Glycoside hydrolase family 28 protein n=1 Tax=Flavobacterium cellulosilyticum TaxID=2541731 RepID=A0A4R5C349_9FLAO|nr:glycoside hydrolase family 28 protein [Flavobacterium cellulosilyticum]TDD94081.1 glycoside hydrolase family 28 protein [Flavobacterium cellulosilyticum]